MEYYIIFISDAILLDKTGILEYWRYGILEYRNTGILSNFGFIMCIKSFTSNKKVKMIHLLVLIKNLAL